MKCFNSKNIINDNKVNNIPECNLLHVIINNSEGTKNINSHYSPILHAFMNRHKGKARFKNFRILLDSRCSFTIVTRKIITQLNYKENAVMQWHTQAGKITNNMKVKIYFTSPEFSAKKIVTWNCHVDDPTKGRYNMILGRDI